MNALPRISAFTPFDLLVVIAIIAVLSALTLAEISRSHKQADHIACRSNIRQIHSSGSHFAGENDGAMARIWPILSDQTPQ